MYASHMPSASLVDITTSQSRLTAKYMQNYVRVPFAFALHYQHAFRCARARYRATQILALFSSLNIRQRAESERFAQISKHVNPNIV